MTLRDDLIADLEAAEINWREDGGPDVVADALLAKGWCKAVEGEPPVIVRQAPKEPLPRG